MRVSLERLGRGAAYVVQDEGTGSTLLLSCGKDRSDGSGTGSSSKPQADDGSDYESAGSASDVSSALPSSVREYARELKELIIRENDAKLDAVLITDYRPSTCYMLPFLMEKCTAPIPVPVYLTHATRALAPPLLTEYWTGLYGASKDKSAPYNEKDILAAFRKTTAVALKACIAVNEHVKITAYHSGHIAGGCAFYIELGSSSILYVNDFSLAGGRVLLPAQIPRLYPSTLIARSSFAVSVSETKTAMEREFMKVVYECVHSDGKVIIPVYRLGFFHELMTILLDYWKRMKFTCPIYLSNEAMEYPGRYNALLRRTYTDSFRELLAQREQAAPRAAPDVQPFDWKRLQQPGPFILFTGPANISQGDSLRAIKACASDPKNLIVLSEHCTPGTVNYMLYADPQRKEISKRLGVNVSCGVHYLPCGDEADAKSIVELAARVSPQQVLLDYVVPEDMNFIRAHIKNHLKHDPEIDAISVSEISPVGPTEILPPREIALRIHKSMFNNPSDVQGMLVVEAKRKMMLVTVGNGTRRLKKKRHSLHFSYTWKKAPEASVRVKKRSSRAPSSALSFLLSAAVESADEDEPEEQPHANAEDLLRTLTEAVGGWIRDVTIEQNDQWIKIRSVGVSVSSEWQVNLEWAYEDEELAGRILGIAKQVIHAEYAKALDQ